VKLTLGFSPCPNDTFIFDALVNKKIDTEGIEFDVALEDVQTLNEWAIANKIDISKISYGVLPLVLNNYTVLDSGGALGKGVGPLLVTKTKENVENINSKTVAIPGRNTTAHLLFSFAFPNALQKQFMRFDNIEKWLLDDKASVNNGHAAKCGVIIHENRFTYEQKGLHKIVDLGEYWEEKTQSPIPLGGIVMKRTIDIELQKTVDRLVRQSVEYAFGNYPFITDYVKQHSQEMDEQVMRKHINLYVTDYSLSLGEEGRRAVKKLLEIYEQVNNEQVSQEDIFLN